MEDIAPRVSIEGGDEAADALRHIGETGAEAFAKIAESAAEGNFTGLATLVGGELAGAFTKVSESVIEFVHSQAEAIETLHNIATISGESLGGLEGLKTAFAEVGVSAQGFERSIGRLTQTIGQSWASIQQSVRVSGNEQASAQIQVQQAIFNTEKAFHALDEAATRAAQTMIHDAQGITDAEIGLQKAILSQEKGLGIDTKPQEHVLQLEEQMNAVVKARQALEDANIKAAEDEAKATEELKQKQLDLQKAHVAQAEAAEKEYQVHLKNIPEIAEELERVAKGTDKWKDHMDLADVSAEILAKSVIKAASAGGERPTVEGVLKEMAELFSKTGDKAIDMGSKVEIVQRLMGAGFRAGQASAAQLIAVLDKGPESLEKFIEEGKKFSESGIGINERDVEDLKEFNAAWAELSAIIGQVAGHLAAVIASKFTEWLTAMKKSLEDNDGVLHGIVQVLGVFASGATAVAGAIASMISEVMSVVGAVGELLGLSSGFQTFAVVIGGVALAFGVVPAAILAVVAAIGALITNFDGVAKASGSAIQGALDWMQRLLDKIQSVIQAVTGPLSAAWEAFASLFSGGGAAAGPGQGGIGHAAEGGMIHGPGGPTADRAGLFALSDGEYVMRSQAVSHYGPELFHALNDMMVGGFAAGGQVGRVGIPAASTQHQQGTSPLTLVLDGQRYEGIRAPNDVAQSLKTHAINRQTAAAGRNPSWMR